MRRLFCALLALLLLLSGCAGLKKPTETVDNYQPIFTQAPSDTELRVPSGEASAAVETGTTAPAGPGPEALNGVEMELPEDLTATPGCPWVPVTVSFPKVRLADPTEPCSLVLRLDGEPVGTWPELYLESGHEEELELSFSFNRYQADRLAELSATLRLGEAVLERRTMISVDNYPEEVYDSLSMDPMPYSIDVLRNQNVVIVYGRDEEEEYTIPVRIWLCSTGPGTPLGDFSLGSKREWGRLFGGVYGQYVSRITGDILFHSVPYTAMQKDSLETEEYNKLGTAASMGCVRLAVSDVKWIYDNCPEGTPVHIRNAEELPGERPELIPLDPNDPRSCWDPTDPDPENPWNETIDN